jgi:hypothetical protein
MNIENTKAQMRKGVLEFCILSVLKEKDAYIGNINFEKRKIISGGGNHLSAACEK